MIQANQLIMLINNSIDLMISNHGVRPSFPGDRCKEGRGGKIEVGRASWPSRLPVSHFSMLFFALQP